MPDQSRPLVSISEEPFQFNMAAAEMQQIALEKDWLEQRWPLIVARSFTEYRLYFGVLQTLADRISVWDDKKAFESTKKLFGGTITRQDKPIELKGLLNTLPQLIGYFENLQNQDSPAFSTARYELQTEIISQLREAKLATYTLLFDTKITIGKKERVGGIDTGEAFRRIAGIR